MFEALGHTCIRVVDSSREDDWHDVVFNYGTFDAFDPSFGYKMMAGELDYYLSVFRFDSFQKLFVAPERSVTEQVLNLSQEQKYKLLRHLEWNAKDENKYYRYDFFHDDCATRIYQAFCTAWGDALQVSSDKNGNNKLTYYDMCLPYYRYRHWERVGGQIIFAGQMSKPISLVERTFLPDGLLWVVAGATVEGRKLTDAAKVLQPDTLVRDKGMNQPMMLAWLIMTLSLMGLLWSRAVIMMKWLTNMVLFLLGILGVIILFMWLWSHYAGTEGNMNILWALPTGVLVPFLKPSVQRVYAVIAVGLVVIFIALWFAGTVSVPMAELGPVLLSVILGYVYLFRKGGRTSGVLNSQAKSQ